MVHPRIVPFLALCACSAGFGIDAYDPGRPGPRDTDAAGGAILASAPGSHALGVYRNRALSATEGYGLCNFLYGDTGSTDFSTSKWNLLERPSGGLDAGTYAWDFFLVVGSLADVVAGMDELYARGE